MAQGNEGTGKNEVTTRKTIIVVGENGANLHVAGFAVKIADRQNLF